MKIAYLAGPKKIGIRQKTPPTIEKGCCLVAVKACAICGSEKEVWAKGGHPDPEFANDQDCAWFGHEAVGEIVEVGEGVLTWRKGDRVALYNIIGCGKCRWCLQGLETYCRNSRTVGQGFREYALVPWEGLLPLPDGVSFELGTLMTDTLGTALRAVRRAEIKQGEAVAVVGLGPIGLLIAQAAKYFGAGQVIGVDSLENRRKIAAEFSLDEFMVGGTGMIEKIKAVTNDGADVVFNTVASSKVCQQGYDALCPGGRLVSIVSMPEKIDWFSERRVIGCAYFLKKEYQENIDLAMSGCFNVGKLLTHRFSFGEIDQAFGRRFENQAETLKVVVIMNEKEIARESSPFVQKLRRDRRE